MEELVFYRPQLEELDFREQWLSDPATMAYNHAYGGTIAFPRERWAEWYARWLEDETGMRFFRYLRCQPGREFVGSAAYHYDTELGEFVCEVLVAAPYRGRGFGRQGLALLCAAARSNGVKRLVDDIAIDNPSAELFLRAGFRERLRTDAYILLEKDL